MSLLSFIGSLYAGEVDPSIPPALADWRDAAYTQRYFIKVNPPGEAGSVNLQREPETASIILPLRTVTLPGKPPRPEAVLLLSEDGSSHSVLLKPVGNDVEVIFRSKPQSRRFCLYTGPLNGEPKKVSPALLETVPLRVKMRGRTASPGFAFSEVSPLTIERFQKMEESGEPVVGAKVVSNINNPECPFLNVHISQFGHIQAVINPLNYAAMYEGFLRAPVDGDYKFSIDTLGAAGLVIDGVPLISAPASDARRLPFALTKSVELKEGLHRVVVYYADASPQPALTSASQSLFGVRLHWQPPFAKSMICVPPQAFVKAMPAVVTRFESDKNYAQPFIQVENLGQVRVCSHLGDAFAREWVLVVAKGVGSGETSVVKAVGLNLRESASAPGGSLAVWVPAGEEIALSIVSRDPQNVTANRNTLFPVLGKGSPDLMDLEGELVIKSSPDFVYPKEQAHIHLEAMLSPAPILILKEYLESKLLPPAPRPMGEFRVEWQLSPLESGDLMDKPAVTAATPLESARKKVRVSVSAAEVEELARAGKSNLVLRLWVGDCAVQSLRVRLHHSTSPWPVGIEAASGSLNVAAAKPVDPKDGDRMIVIVPAENESEYRKFAPLKALERRDLGRNALFIGDPLIEGIAPKAGEHELFGIGKLLAEKMPEFKWSGICIPGPHREMPVFRLLADLESFAASQPDKKIPGLVIVSLGGGDVARQTPLHTFERAIDTLIDRLRFYGAKKIVICGVVPEPWRDKQCAPYQERLSDMLRQHHIDSVDIFSSWTKEETWVRYFWNDKTGKLIAPVPNAQARENIAEMIKDRI